MDAFPGDWKYYTLTYPVARYKHLSLDRIVQEMNECNSTFYSVSNILSRLGCNLLAGRNPLFSLVGNLTSRKNSQLFAQVYEALWRARAGTDEVEPSNRPHPDLLDMWETAAQHMRRLATALKLQAAWFFRQP